MLYYTLKARTCLTFEPNLLRKNIGAATSQLCLYGLESGLTSLNSHYRKTGETLFGSTQPLLWMLALVLCQPCVHDIVSQNRQSDILVSLRRAVQEIAYPCWQCNLANYVD